MKQYTPKQLQENLDEILQEVQAGLAVEILRDGQAIAIIINQTNRQRQEQTDDSNP